MTTTCYSGHARLEVDLVTGQSTVTSAWAVSPIKLLTPRARGPSVWSYTSTFGGGLVAGDEVSVNVRLRPRARCFLGSQASTKVYRSPNGRACSHFLRGEMETGSILVLAPDPIQAFADSIYEQRQEFFLEANAGLVLVDWLSAGRLARGERWAFRRFESQNEVFVAGQRLLLDALRLDPADGPLDSPFRMGRFNCLATVVIAGAPLRHWSEEIFERVSAEPISRRAALVEATSRLLPAPMASRTAQHFQNCGSQSGDCADSVTAVQNAVAPTRAHRPNACPKEEKAVADLPAPASCAGVILRIAGLSVEHVGARIAKHLGFVRELLHDDPWTRKW